MEQQPFNSPPPIPPSYQPPHQPGGPIPPNVSSTKLTAGLCGILIGGLGIHKFVLGYTTEGVITIVATILTCGVFGIVPFIEGIMYLVKSDQEFYETYMLNKKAWF